MSVMGSSTGASALRRWRWNPTLCRLIGWSRPLAGPYLTPQYMPRGGGLSYFTPVHPGTGPADFWRASITMGVRAPYFRAAGADFTAAPRPFGAPIFAISDSARFVSADLGFEYATPVQPGAGPALWVRRVDGEGVRLVGDADFASFEAGFGTRSPILARRDLARRVSAETGPLDFEGVRMDTFS